MNVSSGMGRDVRDGISHRYDVEAHTSFLTRSNQALSSSPLPGISSYVHASDIDSAAAEGVESWALVHGSALGAVPAA